MGLLVSGPCRPTWLLCVIWALTTNASPAPVRTAYGVFQGMVGDLLDVSRVGGCWAGTKELPVAHRAVHILYNSEVYLQNAPVVNQCCADLLLDCVASVSHEL